MASLEDVRWVERSAANLGASMSADEAGWAREVAETPAVLRRRLILWPCPSEEEEYSEDSSESAGGDVAWRLRMEVFLGARFLKSEGIGSSYEVDGASATSISKPIYPVGEGNSDCGKVG